MNRCLICGAPCLPGRATCSDDCHEAFIMRCEEEFGAYKKVTSIVTGKTYKVPTRDIIERGLRHEDLENYPEWEET